jgi:hypothetical protein
VFIFRRPLVAVLGGLTFALLVVGLDRLGDREPLPASVNATGLACAPLIP